MADVTPSQIFPGISADGTSLIIPFSALPGLTSSEGNGVSGDAREILRIICETAYQKIAALSSNARPSRMTIAKTSPRGVGPDLIRQEYTLAFDISIDPQLLTMADE